MTAVGNTSVSVIASDDPDPVAAGGSIVYTVTVSNEGPSDATDVALAFTPPPTTAFQSLSAPAGWTCNAPALNATGVAISCTTPLFAPGSAVFTFEMRVPDDAADGSVLTASVDVTQTSAERDPGDESATVETTVQWVANLSVDKSGPATVPAGTAFEYQVDVQNAGPDAALDATLTDVLPAGVVFESLAPVAGWTCTTPAIGSTGTITCTHPSLPAPGTTSFLIGVRATGASGTTLVNTATVSTSSTDPTENGNEDSVTSLITPNADLRVTKSGAATVYRGETLVYAIDVTNDGPADATAAVLSDTVAAPATFVSLASPADWTCTTPAVGAAGAISCTAATLAAGSTASFTLTVAIDATATPGTSLVNTASASSSTPDADPANNSDDATTVIQERTANLGVTKSGPSTVSPGSDITYTIGVTNLGPDAAPNATVTDELLLPFVSVAAPAGWSCTTPAPGATGTLTCTTASLAVNAPATFTLILTVPSSTQPGTQVTNSATVSSGYTDPQPGDNTSPASAAAVVSPATLTVSKRVTAGAANPGTEVTYEIVIANSGPGTQFDNPGDELVDALPAGLQLLSATASGGIVVANTGTNQVTWNGSIASGGSVTIGIVARVVSGSPVNTAVVHFDADGNGTNESTASASATLSAIVPALSTMMLILLGLMLALIALRR